MTGWIILLAALLAGIGCSAIVCLRGNPPSGAVALQAASAAGAVALLVTAVIEGQDYLFDAAVVFAILSFTGSLVFLHYIEAL